MIYEPYSIVVVPFPFTDKSYSKKRPAIALSHTEHQLQTANITLLMVTTAKASSWPNDYVLTTLTDTGLNTESIVRQKLFTIDSRLVIKKIGQLSIKDKSAIMKILNDHLCLT